MTKCVMLVGPMCAGKTLLAEKLIEKKFLNNESNFYSIEQNRRDFGDGQMSGEMFAWANFLQQIEYPATDGGIYEFSGTGKNLFNVSKAMAFASQKSDAKWLVVYCLAPKNVLMERFPTKTYDSPCPYTLDNPSSSIEWMNGQLKESYEDQRQWNGNPKMKFNMDVEDYGQFADAIMEHFNN